MSTSTTKKLLLLALFISVLHSLRNPQGVTEKAFDFSSSSSKTSSVSLAFSGWPQVGIHSSTLQYDFYRTTCPQAENIVRLTMTRIFSHYKDAPPALLRLFFHDCFVQGCDASVMLDDSNGNKNHSIEREAIPNRTLRGFDKIDTIKEELEQACPGIVSCADILALATRDGILLAGGPFYPVFTGRRDSTESYYYKAMTDIPKPDDNITEILHLFAVRGFSERETVSLLGGHNIGQMGCEFIQNRLNNFTGTGQPDPNIPSDFLNELRTKCQNGNSSSTSNRGFPSLMRYRGMSESALGSTQTQELFSSISSGSGFDAHYYQNLLRGRGILFSDQQLMAVQSTASLVSAYASDDGSTFRRNFASAIFKLSNLGVLTGSQGQVRLNCSMPLSIN